MSYSFYFHAANKTDAIALAEQRGVGGRAPRDVIEHVKHCVLVLKTPEDHPIAVQVRGHVNEGEGGDSTLSLSVKAAPGYDRPAS